MKVKVCSVDELPSCTKLSDDLFENEDEWCNEREIDEDMNIPVHYTKKQYRTSWLIIKQIISREETLSDLIVQSSADDQQDYTGNISNEAYGCSQVVGEDCTEQFGFIESPVRTPSSNVTTSFDTETMIRSPAEAISGLVELRVIDLTTLAPLCRRDLCGKKSRVATVYPQIIDLTESTNFIQL
ncbi:hypothetical protein L3X38_022005 [Prunus dulcis]|uniref:Uncharacterized protein n=1 Tax=Prunus dulcis TaxID=3755 RepID=A0AAD4VWS3_PRUDU|nr:hypothetical protein L3X38_022005 [Prunus dulcis]